MNPPIPIVLGTRNKKKGREIALLIAPPWEHHPRLARLAARTLDEWPDLPDVVEDDPTFAGNARKKASETARALGLWVVADDSGLTVDALKGAPGVLSARYAGAHGDDDANNRLVLEQIDGVPDDRRGAAFVCTLALADPTGSIRLEAEGSCRGLLTRELRGPGGFGYDPYFEAPDLGGTFAESSIENTARNSHRSRAFRALLSALRARGRI